MRWPRHCHPIIAVGYQVGKREVRWPVELHDIRAVEKARGELSALGGRLYEDMQRLRQSEEVRIACIYNAGNIYRRLVDRKTHRIAVGRSASSRIIKTGGSGVMARLD